jgi:hypothetical protein
MVRFTFLKKWIEQRDGAREKGQFNMSDVLKVSPAD